MDLNLENLLKKIAEFLKAEMRVETAVGKEFQLGQFSCVPIIKVSMGFSGGGTDGELQMIPKQKTAGQGAALGAGVSLEPLGFLVTKGNSVRLVSTDESKGLEKALEQLPEVFSKYLEQQKY